MHGPAFQLKRTLHDCAYIIWLFLAIADGPEVDEIVNNGKLYSLLLYSSVRVFMNISSIELATIFCD